jgi:AcrR family transcriptional regulator
MTVFNYFPTKEDLVFGGMEFFEEQLIAAVQQRAPEESAVAAFGRMVLADIDQLPARTEMIAKAAMLIRSSLALQARERESQPATRPGLPAYSPRRPNQPTTTSRRGQPRVH